MKGILCTILAALLCLTMAACGSSDDHAGEAKTPPGSSVMQGRNYQDVIETFEEKGFTNIKTEKIDDLVTGCLTEDGEIEKVSVGGDEDYSPDKWVPADTEVIIYYHTFPADEEAASSMIMDAGLLAGCDNHSVSVTEPVPQEIVKVQGLAMRLNRDDMFEIYEQTVESGVFQQNYRTNLPYESHSKSMLDYYVETHLLGEAGLTLLRQDETEIEGQMLSILFFTHPEAEVIPGTDYCLMLAFCEADDGGTEILISCADSLTFEEWDTTAQAVPEQESASKPNPAEDPAVLPDFLNTGTDYEVSSSTTSHMKVYTADNMDISAVETYLQQLQDMGYAIVYTETNDFKGIDRRWELAHSGLDAEPISENGAHVIVQSNTYTSWNDQTLSIKFSDGITMDAGDISISTPSTGGGYVDCPSCSGGSCTACNGRKGEYSYSPGLEREWEECWKCNGTGDCSRCGGDGRIFG